MFRLFTDAENVRELLVHRCHSQHFESRKRRGYEVLFAELLKLGDSQHLCDQGVDPTVVSPAAISAEREVQLVLATIGGEPA